MHGAKRGGVGSMHPAKEEAAWEKKQMGQLVSVTVEEKGEKLMGESCSASVCD